MADPKRKDAPQPIAEIEQGPSKFEQFLDNNQRLLIVVGIGFIVSVLGYVAMRTIREDRRHDAGAALVRADDLTALQDVTKNHAGTPAAGSALILTADAQWEDGRQDDSIATLREFLERFPDHEARPTARASLASRLMAQGRTAEARSEFQVLLDDPDARFLAPFALISLGELARKEGDLQQAEMFLTRARDEFPNNNFSSLAATHLLLLRAKEPTEVDPPPPPPAPEEPQAPETGADAHSGQPETAPPATPEAAPGAPEAETAPPAEPSSETGDAPEAGQPAQDDEPAGAEQDDVVEGAGAPAGAGVEPEPDDQ